MPKPKRREGPVEAEWPQPPQAGIRGQIEAALARGEFDHELAERCMLDQLSTLYPQVSPVEGGTDFGRDGDIADGEELPIRVLATTSADVGANVRTSLASMRRHDVPFKRLIVVTTQPGSGRRIRAAEAAAAEREAEVLATYGRAWLVERLYADAEWRERLLGIRGALEALVDRPLQLERSPGAELELRGRDADLARLRESTTDVLLLGVPGVGKSRLLSELPDSRFVVPTSSDGEVADGIRRVRPRRVVVDDSGSALKRLDYLSELRRQEGVEFQLIAVAWPTDEDEVMRHLTGANVIRLDLLDAETIDEIVQDLGVKSYVGRQLLLDQSAGRAGWAVALASLLVAGGSRDLLSGRGLIRAVEPFLRRVTTDADAAMAVLAHIAALGEVRPHDVEAIAQRLGIDVPRVQKVVTGAMAGGLLDRVGSDGLAVQPRGLSDGLITYWFFEQAGSLGLSALMRAWPRHEDQLLSAVITAARLGSVSARSAAQGLFDGGRIPVSTLGQYANLDARAAADAVRGTTGLRLPYGLRPDILRAGALYLVPDAIVELLEEARTSDQGPTSHTDDPIGILSHIARGLHPDFGHRFGARAQILTIAATWADSRNDPEGWLVFAKVARKVLDPELSGLFTDPVEANRVHILSGVESPENMGLIGTELMPVVESRLTTMPDEAVALLVPLAEEWAGVARGQVPTSAEPLAPEAAEAARRVAERIVDALGRRASTSRALTVRLRRVEQFFGIHIPAGRDELLEAVSRYPRGEEDARKLADELASIGVRWAERAPAAVATDAAAVRRELSGVGLPAPGLHALFRRISEEVSEPWPWVEAVLDVELCAEASPLIDRAARESPEAVAAALQVLLGGPCRGTIIASLIFAPEGELADRVLQDLEPSDGHVVYWALTGWHVAPVRTLRALINHPVPEVSAAATQAAFVGGTGRTSIEPSLIEEWRQSFLKSAAIGNLPGVNYGLEHVLDALVDDDPALVVDYVLARSEAVDDEDDLVPYHWRPRLATLPRGERERLVRGLSHRRHRAVALAAMLSGDPEWAGPLLDASAVTADDVLDALAGPGLQSFEERASAFETIGITLVDAGLDATRIAAMSEFGMEWGDTVTRLRRRVEYFRNLQASANPSAQRLGAAGLEYFEPRLVEAESLKRDRLRRRQRDWD